MNRRAMLLCFTFGGGSVIGLACTTPSAEQCAVGTEGCACTPGGSCDPGLECLSNLCVDATEGSSGDTDPTAGTMSTSASTTTSTSASTTASSTTDSASDSTGADDECLVHGGERLPLGYCLKTCTYDVAKPGGDLFEDCLPLGMVCNDGSMGDPDFCMPGNWASECSADEDCGAGATCVTTNCAVAVCPYSYCHIDCNTDADCGPYRCVEECPGEDVSPLGYCHGAYGWPADAPYPSNCE